MGCACEKKNRLIRESRRAPEDAGVLGKVFMFIASIIMGILVAGLFIVVAVPVLVYIAVCIVINREPSFNIDWLVRLTKKV